MPKETNVFYRYEVIAADDNTMFFLLDNDTGRILKSTADKTVAESLCFNYNHIPNYDHFNVEEVA